LNIVTPISLEYQKLLKDNPEISDLKEFFSGYVQTILSEKSEKDLNKEVLTEEELK
jgi:methionine salvage enolase-phosphatase E1